MLLPDGLRGALLHMEIHDFQLFSGSSLLINLIF